MNILQQTKAIESQLKVVHKKLSNSESNIYQQKYHERFLQEAANELLPVPIKKHIRCKGVRLVKDPLSRLSVFKEITYQSMFIEWEFI